MNTTTQSATKVVSETKTDSERIWAVIEKIRPYVQTHGGDVRLVGIENSVATVAVDGACVNCPLASLTYNKILRTLIMEELPTITNVLVQ